MRRKWNESMSFESRVGTADYERPPSRTVGPVVTLFFLVQLIGKHPCPRDASLRVGRSGVGPGVHVGYSNAGRRGRRDALPYDALRTAAPTRVSTHAFMVCSKLLLHKMK